MIASNARCLTLSSDRLPSSAATPDARDPFVIPIKLWAIYDPIRDHPGYHDLLRTLNYE